MLFHTPATRDAETNEAETEQCERARLRHGSGLKIVGLVEAVSEGMANMNIVKVTGLSLIKGADPNADGHQIRIHEIVKGDNGRI